MPVQSTPMRTAVLLALAVFAMLPSSALSQAQSSSPVDSVFAAFDRRDSPGCAVAVVEGDRTVLAKGYGMASLEHDVPITPTTAFYAASVSKQFTAFAVALLAQQGKLSLDDDIRKWIPEVPDFGKTIMVRHLIHHTSGLRDYFGLLGMTGWPSDGPITEARFLELVGRQKALNFDPGSRHLYSNTGYVLLSILVKRVSGQSLRQYADSAIFRPLGMNNSHFRDDHAMLIKNRALAYAAQSGGWRLSVPGFDLVGDGGLFTTVEDLARWVRNSDQHTVGGQELAARVLTRGRLTSGDSIPYAFGMVHSVQRGQPALEHGGAYGGYRTHLLRFPEQRFAVAVLCNTTTAPAAQLSQRVAAVYLGNRLAPITESVAASARANHEPMVRHTHEQLARFAGAYWDARNEVLRRVEARDSILVLLGTPIVLLPVSADRFRPTTGTTRFAFVADADGSFRLEETAANGDNAIFRRMPAPRVDAATLQQYAGDYVSEELDVTWQIEPQNGSLLLKRRLLPDQILQPVFLDAFTSTAGVLRFERSADGRATGFVVGGGRVTGFRFEARRR